MKFGRNVLQVNTHRLTESDFQFVTLSRWWPSRHFLQQTAAAWWLQTKRSPGAYAATSTSSWSIVHLYLFQQLLHIGQKQDFSQTI